MPMKHELLRDDYSIEEAERLQEKFAKKILKVIEVNPKNNIDSFETIAGVDVSYFSKEDIEYGIACAVLWSLDKEKMLTHQIVHNQVKFPYKSGFLGFRECKILAMAILKLPCIPDVIMCDGHGKIHPKRFGEAVHLGVALDIPTLGVAKTPFIGYFNWYNMEKIKGNKVPVWAENPNFITNESSNELLGYFVCLNNNSKPIFISEGNKIILDLAVNLCLNTTNDHRQPEPLYLADKFSREEVEKYTN